jgi:cytoskeletal protein CcmA (bactofilin family)
VELTVPDLTVARGETTKLGLVEGVLKIGRNATVQAESGRKVVVTGGVVFDGGATVDCSLECVAVEVRARAHTGGTIKVHGDLTVHQAADIADSLEVAGTARADTLDVGGHLTAESIISKRVRIGGHLKVSGLLESESVDVAGHLAALGRVKMVDLHVGGHAEVGGGAISGTIMVRSDFLANSALEYGELQTYGHVNLPAGSKGDRMSALGRVEFGGDTSCRRLDVKGVAQIAGNCSSEDVEVGGKMNVSGSLIVHRELKVFGVTEVGGKVKCESMIVGGRLKADVFFVEGEADIDGDVESIHGLKAKTIFVRRGSRVVGPLVGDRIEIGKTAGAWRFPLGGRLAASGRNTSVQDVHGGTIVMGHASRAKVVFAEALEMDDGSHAEQVAYTKTLKLRMNNLLSRPAVKVTELPAPPI